MVLYAKVEIWGTWETSARLKHELDVVVKI